MRHYCFTSEIGGVGVSKAILVAPEILAAGCDYAHLIKALLSEVGAREVEPRQHPGDEEHRIWVNAQALQNAPLPALPGTPRVVFFDDAMQSGHAGASQGTVRVADFPVLADVQRSKICIGPDGIRRIRRPASTDRLYRLVQAVARRVRIKVPALPGMSVEQLKSLLDPSHVSLPFGWVVLDPEVHLDVQTRIRCAYSGLVVLDTEEQGLMSASRRRDKLDAQRQWADNENQLLRARLKEALFGLAFPNG